MFTPHIHQNQIDTAVQHALFISGELDKTDQELFSIDHLTDTLILSKQRNKDIEDQDEDENDNMSQPGCLQNTCGGRIVSKMTYQTTFWEKLQRINNSVHPFDTRTSNEDDLLCANNHIMMKVPATESEGLERATYCTFCHDSIYQDSIHFKCNNEKRKCKQCKTCHRCWNSFKLSLLCTPTLFAQRSEGKLVSEEKSETSISEPELVRREPESIRSQPQATQQEKASTIATNIQEDRQSIDQPSLLSWGRQTNQETASTIATNEQEDRQLMDERILMQEQLQEQLTRQANQKIASTAAAKEQERRMAEDIKMATQEEMTRTLNQQAALKAATTEQARRVAEDDREMKENCRRKSISIMDDLRIDKIERMKEEKQEQGFDFVGDFVLDNDIEEDEDTKDIPKIIQQPIPEGYVSTNRNAWISEKNGGVIHRFILPTKLAWGIGLKFLPNGLFIIVNVEQNGAAHAAGVQCGDYLVEVGGDDLHAGDLDAAMKFILAHKQNETATQVEFVVVRNSENLKTSCHQYRKDWLKDLDMVTIQMPWEGSWGMSMKHLPNSLFLIHSIGTESVACETGVANGDYLVSVGGIDLNDSDLKEVIRVIGVSKKSEEDVVLVVMRRGKLGKGSRRVIAPLVKGVVEDVADEVVKEKFEELTTVEEQVW